MAKDFLDEDIASKTIKFASKTIEDARYKYLKEKKKASVMDFLLIVRPFLEPIIKKNKGKVISLFVFIIVFMYLVISGIIYNINFFIK